MNTVTATYAKQNFGTCITAAAKQPVVIEKSGRASIVMISYEEFLRLNELEDAIWLRRAEQAAQSGYLSAEESDEFMQNRLKMAAENLSV